MRTAVKTVVVRERILDATDDFLARYGYQKMTIDDLAEAVGIGKGSIYLHFGSKEEIALSHVDRIIERLKVELRIIAAKKISPEMRIRQMLLKRVLQRFDSVQHYAKSLDHVLSALRLKLLERRKTYFAEEARIFAVVIDEGQKAGRFAAGNPLQTATILLLATNSLLPYSLTTRELGERDEVESKTRRLADLLLKGLVRREK